MILEFLAFIFGLGLAITIHEAAHCFTADYLGDPTPRSQGRTTLDPRAHLDPFGIGLPILLRLVGSPIVFGWGKPSPYDPYNLSHPKRDSLLIALAGPASNILIATAFAIFLRFIHPSLLISPVITIISLNVSIALFNLLPLPPLDGSKILLSLLSREQAYRLQAFTQQNSTLLLIILIFPFFGGASLATLLISPLFYLIINLLLPH